MIVSNKYKLLYVHIPKTGGSTLRAIIQMNDPRAIQPAEYHQPITPELHKKYEQFLRVVVVRNSWEICASCYRFESSGKPRQNFMPDRNMSFYDWLQWKSEFRKPCHYPFPRQLPYITLDGTLVVDRIIRYEDYNKEVRQLCYDFDMKFINKKAHYYGEYDYRKIYKDDRDIQLVADICKEDIEYFGWKYESD